MKFYSFPTIIYFLTYIMQLEYPVVDSTSSSQQTLYGVYYFNNEFDTNMTKVCIEYQRTQTTKFCDSIL
jgi:hypothetical protein